MSFWDVLDRQDVPPDVKEEIRRHISDHERQNLLLSHLPGLLFMTDDAGRILSFWGPAEELYASPDSFIGKTVSEVLPPDASEMVLGIMSQSDLKDVALGGYSLEMPAGRNEYSLKTRKIQYHGQYLYIHSVNNITELKRQESELRASESLFRSLFENMLNGFAYCRMIFDKGKPQDFIYLQVNEAFESLTGLRDVQGKKVTEVIPGIRESDPGLFEIYGRVALSGVPERFETYVGALGMWFSVSVYSPRKEYFVAVFDVITERKQAEEELRKSESRYRNTLDNMMEGCQILGFDWRYLYVNETAAKHGHSTVNELLGHTIMEKYPGIEKTDIFAVMRNCMEARTARLLENEFVYPDGSKGYFEMSIQPVPEGIFILSLDITERKRTEAERERLETQLLQAQKMESVGRLAGGVAHDFNNQLSVILTYSDMMMKDYDSSSPQYQDLKEIRDAASRSADLTRQLLAFARKQTVSPKVLDLNDTVSGLLKMLGRLIGEDIDLAWIPGHDLWEVRIDPSQIDQVLANLVVNARDAITGVGKVTIEAKNAVFDEAYCADHAGFIPGEYVMLAVSDNGCGMDRETIRNIFDPFFTTKEMGKGTGLGLATVYGIVKQNEGFINVYSEPGQGTTFRIYFLRHDAVGGEAPAKPEMIDAQRGTETILLVEDDETLLKMGKRLLESLGYTIVTAGSPDEAISQVQRYPGEIHLLVTDVVMPGMNGLDMAARLSSARPGLKCLFMSGYTANVIAHHGVLDDGVCFIQKPFSKETLSEKVREAMYRR